MKRIRNTGGKSGDTAPFKGTVKLKIFFAEKGAFIIDKKRDVFNFFKFDP